jgi:protein ImuA
MDQSLVKKDIFQRLQKELLILQGLQKPDLPEVNIGLRGIERAFPGKAFPTGGIHEFISHSPESRAATDGFIAGLLGRLMTRKGYCLWVSAKDNPFPPAVKSFGIAADKIIFVTPGRGKDILWAIEEGLKCKALTAVVGQIKELSFIESRRLQLAVEQSGVTGMIHRHCPQRETPVACVARWKIKPLASTVKTGMPGLGNYRWEVQLPRIRNGRPGIWQVEWTEADFHEILNN